MTVVTMRSHVRNLLTLFGALLLTSVITASPALASHQKGGSLTTAITANGHFIGTLRYLELGSCTNGGAAPAQSLTVTAPNGAQRSLSVPMTYNQCLPNLKGMRGTFDVDMAATWGVQETGTYVTTFSSCCRIAGIVNASSTSTLFTSQVRSIPGSATGSPNLDANTATGIGIGYEYRQNLNTIDPDGGALTYNTRAGQPDGPGSDVVTYTASGDVVIPAATTSTFNNGAAYIYKVRVNDAQGDFAERDVLLTATNTNRPPVLSGMPAAGDIVVAPGDSRTITVSASDPDAGDTVTISASNLPSYITLSRTSGNPATATLTIAPPAGAPNAYVAINLDATDNNGAVLTASTNFQIKIGVPPETAIDSAPTGTSADPTPTFAFSADLVNGTTYECRIDTGAWTSCTSPYSPTVADGTHTFSVRATNLQITDPTPATSGPFTVDTTGPVAPALDTKPRSIDSVSAFTYTAAELGGTLECRFDTGAWNPCTDPAPALADGLHTFQVRQVDDLGNVGQPATFTWTLDTASPLAPELTSSPSEITREPSVSFAFTGEPETGSFECRLDGGAWVTCASPTPFGPLSDGSHTFEVRQVDDAGNISPVTAATQFTIDTVAPVAPSVGGEPGAAFRSADVKVPFDGGEPGGSYDCRLDDGDWEACTSPVGYSDLADGPHTVRVRQTDAAGNAGAVAARSFVVDTVAPGAPVLTSVPADRIATPATTVAFVGEEGTTLECRLDGAAWEACTSPLALRELADGGHTVDVRQTDEAGNVSDASRASFAVDTTPPPAPRIDHGPAEVSNLATIAFSGEGEHACRIDGGAWAPCTSPLTPAGLADGSHVVEIRSADDLENTSPATAVRFVLDRTPPAAPAATAGPIGTTKQSTATFSFGGEPGGSYECRLDDGAWVPCSGTQTYEGLTAGAHVVRFRQIDAAGNLGPELEQRFVVGGVDRQDTKRVDTDLASSATVRKDSLAVGCRLDHGALHRCVVKVYATVVEHGKRRRVVVGVGSTTTSGAGRRRGEVAVKLNRRGRALLKDTLGGVKVDVRTTATARDDARVLHSKVTARMFPQEQFVVPTDGLFPTDSAALSKAGRQYVDHLRSQLGQVTSVTCVGHTDASGAAAYNAKLGLARAETVCRSLEGSGEGRRTRSESAGERRPRATNTTAAGRALNRRVELAVRYR